MPRCRGSTTKKNCGSGLIGAYFAPIGRPPLPIERIMDPVSPEPESEPTAGRRRLSLAGQLMVLVALLSLGPLLVTNIVGYQRTKDLIEEITQQALRNAARVAANDTADFVRERKAIIASLTADNIQLSETARQAARELGGDGVAGQPRVTDLEEHLRAKARAIEAPVDFYVLSPAGQVLGSSTGPKARGQWRTHDRCLAAAGSPSGLAVGHRSRPILYLGTPIEVAGEASPGIFCARSDFSIYAQLQELAAAQAPVERFVLANAQGAVLVDTASPAGETGAVAPALRQRLTAAEPWSGVLAGDGDDAQFVALTPVASTDWFAVAEVSDATALAVLDELKARVFWMGSAFVLVVVLGMLLMVHATIGPLRDLVRATREMARGRLVQHVDTRGPREVAELAGVFNAMSAHVADLHRTLEDRVEQRTAELQRNQAFSKLLFNAMHENLVVIDGDMRIIEANDAARATYGDDLVGRPCSEVFEDSEDCDNCTDQCPVRAALERGALVEEERVHARDGHTEIMHTQVFPLPAAEGSPPNRVLMVSRPITQEKQERAAEAAGEKVSAYALMAASVADEIGNPLASISAQLQLARRKNDPQFTEKVMGIIEQQVERISGLLKDITAFSSRQSKRATLVYWNQIVEDAVRLLKHDPKGRFAAFQLDLADELPAVYAEPESSFQVLLDLGLNALDAMDGHGTIRFETELQDDQVIVRVCDTGPGVDQALRDQIFEPYFTTKDGGAGRGLGLFISRRMVEQMGGTLEYDPPSDGQGARFVVRMPLATQERMRG